MLVTTGSLCVAASRVGSIHALREPAAAKQVVHRGGGQVAVPTGSEPLPLVGGPPFQSVRERSMDGVGEARPTGAHDLAGPDAP